MLIVCENIFNCCVTVKLVRWNRINNCVTTCWNQLRLVYLGQDPFWLNEMGRKRKKKNLIQSKTSSRHFPLSTRMQFNPKVQPKNKTKHKAFTQQATCQPSILTTPLFQSLYSQCSYQCNQYFFKRTILLIFFFTKINRQYFLSPTFFLTT